MNILVNGETIHLEKKDFPVIISGREGCGSSAFSISLALDLFKRGHKLLIFPLNRQAKTDFRQALSSKEAQEEVEFVDKRDDIEGKRAIVITSGDEDTFIEVINNLEDLDDRIVLVRGMEKYSVTLFGMIKNSRLLVLSGNIDKCQYSKEVKKKNFNTKIFFSKPQNYPVQNFVEPEKRQGVIMSKSGRGVIKLIS